MRLLRSSALLLGLLAGAASAAWDFFPDGATSFPAPWGQPNQTAARAVLGGALGEGLLTIAIADPTPAKPTLFFKPGAWCSVAGATVGEAQMAQLQPVSRRRLQAAGRKLLAPGDLNITSPCTLTSVRWNKAGNATATTLTATAGVYKVELENADIPDTAETCIVITATYDTSPAAFATSPGYNATYGVLVPSKAFTQTVCMFKRKQPAQAALSVDMCKNNTFMVNVSEVYPLAVPLKLNGLDQNTPLFKPLLKVWGPKVAELDGTPASTAYDGSASLNQAVWITKYIPLPSNYTNAAGMSVQVSPLLEEGYYNLSAAISMVTRFPSLMNVTGLNQIEQSDAAGVSAGVSGQYEVLTNMLYANKTVGVQKLSTPTIIAAITSNKAGKAIATDDPIKLTWQFGGVGTTTCKHDADPLGECGSPFTIAARDVQNGANHTLTVTFLDVCGRTREAKYTYNAQGAVVNTPKETLASDGTILMDTAGTGATTKPPAPKNAAPVLGVSGAVATLAGGAALLLALA